jgi:DNA modification methylase
VKPYYSDGSVTIYHGDCREFLAALEADVLVTDPPYGIGWKQHGGGVNGKTRGSRRHHGIVGDEDTAVRDEILAAWPGPALVFGSFRAPAPAGVRQTLIFRKTPDAGLMGSVTGFRTDVEPVYLLGPWPKRNAHRSSVIESRIGLQRLQDGDSHPHAKPLDVMSELLMACPPGTILDPFMGSGSTLRAAKNIGRRAIGIEIVESYCDIAAKRCAQEVLAL